MAGPHLHDNVWTRRGISLLWDADALAAVCKPQQVVSLRHFLLLHAEGWPADRIPLINDRVIVVAGLDTALDAIGTEEATEWVRAVVYKAILSFQSDVADGGNGAAVILWFTDGPRFQCHPSEDSYEWKYIAGKTTQFLPLGRWLFNGAEKDVQEIHMRTSPHNDQWIGLFHPRIS